MLRMLLVYPQDTNSILVFSGYCWYALSILLDYSPDTLVCSQDTTRNTVSILLVYPQNTMYFHLQTIPPFENRIIQLEGQIDQKKQMIEAVQVELQYNITSSPQWPAHTL